MVTWDGKLITPEKRSGVIVILLLNNAWESDNKGEDQSTGKGGVQVTVSPSAHVDHIGMGSRGDVQKKTKKKKKTWEAQTRSEEGAQEQEWRTWEGARGKEQQRDCR